MSFDPIKEHGHLYSSIKRVRKPPGGDSSDIFGTNNLSVPPKITRMSSPSVVPVDEPTPPQKVDSTFRNIFGDVTVINGRGTLNESVSPTVATPRSVKDHQKSNIFFCDVVAPGSTTPVLNGQEPLLTLRAPRDITNGDQPLTNILGQTARHYEIPRVAGELLLTNALGQTGVVNPIQKKGRIPPGGFSTKLW